MLSTTFCVLLAQVRHHKGLLIREYIKAYILAYILSKALLIFIFPQDIWAKYDKYQLGLKFRTKLHLAEQKEKQQTFRSRFIIICFGMKTTSYY